MSVCGVGCALVCLLDSASPVSDLVVSQRASQTGTTVGATSK